MEAATVTSFKASLAQSQSAICKVAQNSTFIAQGVMV